MIWKERGVSRNKEELEVLLRRLPRGHATYSQAEKEDGTVLGRKSPLEQIAENEWLLGDWMEACDVLLPVRSVLVLSYLKQIAENVPAEQPVIFSYQLPMFLNRLPVGEALMSLEEMKDLACMIEAALVMFEPKPICSDARYPIAVMRRGVWCADCERIGMVRRYGSWFCGSCGVSSKDAHLRTIRNWLLLNGEPVTNRLCREIFGVGDHRLVSRLLSRMDLKKEGSFKDAKYRL